MNKFLLKFAFAHIFIESNFSPITVILRSHTDIHMEQHVGAEPIESVEIQV